MVAQGLFRVPAWQAGVSQQARHVVEAGLEFGQTSRRSSGGDRVFEPGFGPALAPLHHLPRQGAVVGDRWAARGRGRVAEEAPQVLGGGHTRGELGICPAVLQKRAATARPIARIVSRRMPDSFTVWPFPRASYAATRARTKPFVARIAPRRQNASAFARDGGRLYTLADSYRTRLDHAGSFAARHRNPPRPGGLSGTSRQPGGRGLLVRIDRAVNKDTELHPLVRWQFLGGLDEDERRAFLFTNVVGADGPALRHAGRGRARWRPRPRHLCARHGPRGRRHRHGVDATPSPHPTAAGGGHISAMPGGGDHRRGPAQRRAAGCRGCRCRYRRRASMPRPISPRRYASPSIRTPGVRNMGTYRAAAEGRTTGWRAHGGARIGGAGGYLHWQKYRARKQPMPCAIVIGCAPRGGLHRPAEACDRSRRDGGGRRARGLRRFRMVQAQ